MIYCPNPESDEPIMLLNKHVGYDEKDGMGIDGALFQNELMALDGLDKKRIQVWINSPGGIVMDGYSIYNAILKSKTPVDTYCVGIAASIAAVIFQAGRKRVMSDYGKLMYHNPFGADSKELNPMKDSIAVMVAERVSKTKDEILSIMKKDTWISASEAFESGFCTEIEVTSEHNKKRRQSTVKAMWEESNKILNSIFNNQTTPIQMKKVTNKLGLNDEANEDAILAAVTTVQNKAEAAAAALNEAEDRASKAEKDAKDAKDALAAMQAEKDAANAAKEAAEAAETAGKAKNMLEAFAKSGRIKADAVASFTEKITSKKLTLDEVKDMIEALPLNKSAAKLPDVTGVANELQLTNVAASVMADIRARQEKK